MRQRPRPATTTRLSASTSYAALAPVLSLSSACFAKTRFSVCQRAHRAHKQTLNKHRSQFKINDADFMPAAPPKETKKASDIDMAAFDSVFARLDLAGSFRGFSIVGCVESVPDGVGVCDSVCFVSLPQFHCFIYCLFFSEQGNFTDAQLFRRRQV